MARFYKDRRRAQAGTTLVELLVALVIIGIALVLIVGTFSTGLLDATVAKRDTSGQAVIQSELERIGGMAFDPNAQPYSECFQTETSAASAPAAVSYQAACPDNTYSLRADVQRTAGPTATTQTWTVTVISWPDGTSVGSPVSEVKANR